MMPVTSFPVMMVDCEDHNSEDWNGYKDDYGFEDAEELIGIMPDDLKEYGRMSWINEDICKSGYHIKVYEPSTSEDDIKSPKNKVEIKIELGPMVISGSYTPRAFRAGDS